MRLNLGCGPEATPGWLNCDRLQAPGLDLRCDLRAGGVLRLAVPDLDRALRAYLAGDARYFYVPDGDARSVRTPCTYDFLVEWLAAAGFAPIERVRFGTSRVSGLAALDNRERESLFVEAVKPDGSTSRRDIAAS